MWQKFAHYTGSTYLRSELTLLDIVIKRSKRQVKLVGLYNTILTVNTMCLHYYTGKSWCIAKYVTTSSDPCGLTGKWRNQAGSTVELTCQSGALSGKYTSAEGEAKGSYRISGRYSLSEKSPGDFILGFSVAWNNDTEGNSESVTSWAGVYIGTQDKIHTKWLLTEYTAVEDIWKNTLIGFDEFMRP